jgi:hypothetical protein
MRIRISVPEQFVSPDIVNPVLEAVTRLDEHLIRAGQAPTSRELLKAGATWRPEPPGDEHFDHAGTIATRGHGDCDDWAPVHAATLRATGEDKGAFAKIVPSGPNTFHAIVQRSDGSIDDPSIAAGMKPQRVVGAPAADPDRIQVWAVDPHNGHVYQGQLLPTVGPLAIHCGPGICVRGAHIVGVGDLWEARCDVPIHGSPLVHVRNYWRHRPHHQRRRRCVGEVPYAISCSSHGETPVEALNNAIVGAILLGDAAEMTTSLDRYKLLAVQAAMSGASPGQVRDALVAQMTDDVQRAAAASGTHPKEHTEALLAQLAAETGIDGVTIGDFFSDIGHIASGVVSAVSSVANTVAHAVSSIPWGDIVHDVEAAVSVVPGIGTAVADVLAAAESAYDAAAAALSGNPLKGAIDAAYNFALASVPGAASLRGVLDPIKNTLEDMAFKKEPIESAILNGLLDSVPDSPKFGPLSPKSVAASLAHLIVGHLGLKNTGNTPTPVPKPALVAPPPHPPPPRAMPLHVATRPAPRKPVPAKKPMGVPHAAVHVLTAPKRIIVPAHVMPPVAAPGSPGAPPGASHWHCIPLPGGQWQCQWR